MAGPEDDARPRAFIGLPPRRRCACALRFRLLYVLYETSEPVRARTLACAFTAVRYARPRILRNWASRADWDQGNAIDYGRWSRGELRACLILRGEHRFYLGLNFYGPWTVVVDFAL